MGSRKENLKKSLGISEYPWSSDEEENNTSQPVQVLRRQSDEPRPSVADMPGTSGLNTGNTSEPGTEPTPPSSPATVRRNQAKMDRALFWSIINNTARPNNVGASRSRLCDVPLSYMTRPAIPARSDIRETRRNERANTSAADIQRILAFKKLTRNLQSLAQTCKQGASMPTTTRRFTGSAGSSRNPLFTPSLPTASSNARTRTYNNNCCTRSQTGRNFLPGYTRNANPPDVLPVTDAQPSSSGRYRTVSRPPTSHTVDIATSTPLPDQYLNVEQSDDDVEAVPVTAPTPEQTEDNNAVEEINEPPTLNVTDANRTISLEEEIMEVVVPDVNINAPVVDVDAGAIEPTVVSEGIIAPPNSDETPEAPQPQTAFHGVKRKRETTDENAEPYSVQEFNQSLLRLLECPVCLEWMEPPISQCRRGHLVCSRCRTRLASCPVCRTTFSSVRNRAMEGVAEMLRYPCRHGCGREVRLRKRSPHEASCSARRYHCPAQPCARHPPLAHHELGHHFQCKHLPIVKIGRKHKFSMKVNSEQHDTWLIMALDEYFHLRVDVDIRTWGVIVYVAYIGPKRKAKHFTYEVTVEGQHNSRSLKYARATHSDLESSSLNVSRQDCFHLTLDQALNFLRFKNRHCEPDKFLDFDVEIDKCQNVSAQESKDDSDT